MRLVSFGCVHDACDAGNSRTAVQRLNFAGDLRNALGPQGPCRRMRRQRDFGVLPERVFRRQGFLPENIQRRTGQVPAVNQRNQVIIHHMATARHIDDIRTRQQPCQVTPVQNTVRFRGQGQQADKDAGGGQKVTQPIHS